MKKITIVKAYGCYSCGDNETFTNAVQNADFQEVTDEEFLMLKENIRSLNKGDYEMVLVEEVKNKFQVIADVIGLIEQRKREAEERYAAREKEKEKQKMLRQEAKARKEMSDIEKKRQQFEKLKKELGEV